MLTEIPSLCPGDKWVFMPAGMVSLHKCFTGAWWKINGKTVKIICLISTITAVAVYVQQHACVRLDIREGKAEEIFQEFIEYLSPSQMLDRGCRMKTRRELPLKKNSKNTKHMSPRRPPRHFCHLNKAFGLWWERPTLPLIPHTEGKCWMFSLFFWHEYSSYVLLCFTGPPLKMVMSSFSQACRGPGGLLSS